MAATFALKAMETLIAEIKQMTPEQRQHPDLQTRAHAAMQNLSQSRFAGILVVVVHSPWNKVQYCVGNYDDVTNIMEVYKCLQPREKRYVHVWASRVLIKGMHSGPSGAVYLEWYAYPYAVAIEAQDRAKIEKIIPAAKARIWAQAKHVTDFIDCRPWRLSVVGMPGPEMHYWSIETRTQEIALALERMIKPRVGPLNTYVSEVRTSEHELANLYVSANDYRRSSAASMLEDLVSALRDAEAALQKPKEDYSDVFGPPMA
jgi:hypothetical protein